MMTCVNDRMTQTRGQDKMTDELRWGGREGEAEKEKVKCIDGI